MRTFYVYILASTTRVLYIGMTNDLARRLSEHRSGNVRNFTGKYRVTRLVHVETYPDPVSAIGREKELKGWRRDRKLALIEAENPAWRDLAVEIFGEP